MVAAVALLLFPHQSPGLEHRYQSFHHHTRSHNSTRSKHIQKPRHHTRGALQGPLDWPGMSGLERAGLGGTQAGAQSLLLLLWLCWCFLQSLLEVVGGLL